MSRIGRSKLVNNKQVIVSSPQEQKPVVDDLSKTVSETRKSLYFKWAAKVPIEVV